MNFGAWVICWSGLARVRLTRVQLQEGQRIPTRGSASASARECGCGRVRAVGTARRSRIRAVCVACSGDRPNLLQAGAAGSNRMPPPLRATRAYEAHEELQLPACLLRPSCPLSVVAAVHADESARDGGCCWGPSEHRIDAFQLRNEASFINDFREVSHAETSRLATHLPIQTEKCSPAGTRM